MYSHHEMTESNSLVEVLFVMIVYYFYFILNPIDFIYMYLYVYIYIPVCVCVYIQLVSDLVTCNLTLYISPQELKSQLIDSFEISTIQSPFILAAANS